MLTNFPNGLTSFGVPLFGNAAGFPPAAKVYWVKKSTDADFTKFYADRNVYYEDDGTQSVYTTITDALAAASNYDTIYIMPGVWTEAATLNITQTGLKFIGYQTSGHQWGQPSIKGSGTNSCIISVNAHEVEIAGISIHQPVAYAGIRIATTDNYWRTHVHDCYFGGNGAGTYGIVMGDTTAGGGAFGVTCDAPCTVVERCYFQDWVTADVFMNCGYGSVVRNCVLEVNANCIGIKYYTDSTSRPFGYILDNKFTAVSNSTSTGISVTNTPTAGYLMIDGNHFIVFGSDNLCITKRTGYTGLNYNGITAVAIT
jgi:hypothetical protein